MALVIAAGLASCSSGSPGLSIEHKGDGLTVVKACPSGRYLLLPIQESSPEALVMLVTGRGDEVNMDIRLAVDSIDYFVPFALTADSATVEIRNVPENAVCWSNMKISDTFCTENTDKFRPFYHHTPLYGWMNDPNGLVYKDGEYHLYYQYNPYGSVWGNMHWGHSVSRDLIHWEHLDVAIARDTLGHIFSGSAVVDKDNTAGFGKDAIVAIYTSDHWKNGQVQSIAWSTDNGRTFTKYEGNPVLVPFDGIMDFRDPKVIWYAPENKWVMVVSADTEMRFYSSRDLKNWEYMSSFGNGYGASPYRYECPDILYLPVDGDKSRSKWVLIANINPGCMFGGSATEYFIGEFDGRKFTCDSAPETIKWMDYGKDHYATVTFSNMEGRAVGIPWMSNWHYAGAAPNTQHRSADALPREFSLFSKDGEVYMASDVVPEARNLRKEACRHGDFDIVDAMTVDSLLPENEGAYEICMEVVPAATGVTGFELLNPSGEKVDIYFDMATRRMVMDRTESGIVDFGPSNIHYKETDEHRMRQAVNYRNDFALGTWAPLSLCEGNSYRMDIFVDNGSVEIFVDGGRIAMTNTVFPSEPYSSARFYSNGKGASVSEMTVYRLGL